MLEAGATAGGIDLSEQDAFALRLEPLLPVAFRLAYAMLRNRDDAEDAVQDGAAQAWRKRTTFRAGAELRPWFLAIVANECRMLMRRNRRPMVVEAREPVPDSDAAQSLRRALIRLDMNSRLALVLRYYLDLNFEEVGKTLGVSAGAARVRVHRALQKLRPAFEVEEGLTDE